VVPNVTHQCVDNVAVMRPLSKLAVEIERVAEIPQHVAAAAEIALSEPLGPAFLSVPIDLMSEDIDEATADAELARHAGASGRPAPAPDPAKLRELHAMLAAARRPVAVVGNAVVRQGATSELRQLVERHGIPVVCTLASKGALPDDHPFALGAMNRYIDKLLGGRILDRVFEGADLIVLVGYDMAEDIEPVHWSAARGARVALLGPADNPIPRLVRADLTIVGDLRQTLAALGEDAASGGSRREPPPFIEELRQLRERAQNGTRAEDGTRGPGEIVAAARRALGKDGIFVSDIGLHKQYAGLLSETREPNTFLCSNGLGSMGFGMAAALGAKLACPDRQVMAFCGDGGFLSNSQDVETLVRLRVPIALVVLRDGAFGLIKAFQLRGHGRFDPAVVDFADTDFVKLAAALGCPGVRVEPGDRLDAALARALDTPGPFLVEVPVRYEYAQV
jgi:acetolactate synthase-1/2/3 large subunit/N2-(2-carboxyethyl)arginine synthase